MDQCFKICTHDGSGRVGSGRVGSSTPMWGQPDNSMSERVQRWFSNFLRFFVIYNIKFAEYVVIKELRNANKILKICIEPSNGDFAT